MRKYIVALIFFFLPYSLVAQFTSVTATITEPSGQTWNNGKYSATLVNPQPQNPPTINGTRLTAAQMSVSGGMNSSGIITTSIADNSVVVPAGTYWQFTLCPNASSRCQVQNASTSGGSQNLSSTLSSNLVNVSFPASPTSYGYADSEVSPVPNPGGIYFNVTSLIQRVWNGSSWVDNGGGGSSTSNPTTCTVNTNNFKCLGVSPYTAISGDWTVALQQAITDLSTTGGGSVFIPCGSYTFSGAFQDPSHANGQVLLPSITAYSTEPQQTIKLAGCMTPPGASGSNGTVFNTTASGGNFISAYNSGGPYPGFTSVWLEVENITCRTYSNPDLVCFNAQNALAAHFTNVWCDPGSTITTPTHADSGCIWMPTIANNVSLSVDNATCVGYYTCFIFTEHTHILSAYAANCVDAFKFDNGSRGGIPGTYDGNAIKGDYLWQQQCTHTITGPTSGNFITVNLGVVDSELATGSDIYDPSDKMYGTVTINNPYQPHTIATTGAVNTHICNLFTQSRCYTSNTLETTGLIEYWPALQLQGTVFNNNGFDFSNYMTGTNVTWTTVTGFPGKVATYNGTSSVAVANSATATAFNGSQPFSVCTWFNLSNLTGGDNWLVNNLDTASSNQGWGLEIFGAAIVPIGGMDVYIANNIPGNMIQVTSPAGLVVAGTTNHACFTYSGIGTANGIQLYFNGVNVASTTVVDTLTLTTASAAPVKLGSLAGAVFTPGAIGGTTIYNGALSATQIANLYALGPQ